MKHVLSLAIVTLALACNTTAGKGTSTGSDDGSTNTGDIVEVPDTKGADGSDGAEDAADAVDGAADADTTPPDTDVSGGDDVASTADTVDDADISNGPDTADEPETTVVSTPSASTAARPTARASAAASRRRAEITVEAAPVATSVGRTISVRRRRWASRARIRASSHRCPTASRRTRPERTTTSTSPCASPTSTPCPVRPTVAPITSTPSRRR